jgi:hypothetical protein
VGVHSRCRLLVGTSAWWITLAEESRHGDDLADRTRTNTTADFVSGVPWKACEVCPKLRWPSLSNTATGGCLRPSCSRLTVADGGRVCFPMAVVLLNVGTSPLRPPTLRDGRPEKTRPSPAPFVGPLPKCEQGSSRGSAGCLPVGKSSRRLMGRSAFKDFSRVHLLGEAAGR